MNIKKKVINPLQAIALVESSLNGGKIRRKILSQEEESDLDFDKEIEKEKERIDQFEAMFNRIAKAMAVSASHSFFDETIGYELKTERLAKILTPFMEKGLTKAFKSKAGLKTFLVNLGYLPDDEEY